MGDHLTFIFVYAPNNGCV